MHFGEFFGIISAFAEELYVEREMNVFNFSGILSAFNFWLGDGDIGIKTKNTNIIDDGKLSVLWHSMKNLVNFIRHLTSITFYMSI